MVAEVFAGLAAFKTMLDSAKALAEMHDESVRLQTSIDLQRQIFSTQQDYAALLDKVRTLETEMASLKAWEGEKQRYELKVVTDFSKVLAYTLKESERGTEPPHWICPNCYSEGHKSILQRVMRAPGRAEVLTCHSCGWSGYLTGLWYPEHGPRSPVATR